MKRHGLIFHKTVIDTTPTDDPSLVVWLAVSEIERVGQRGKAADLKNVFKGKVAVWLNKRVILSRLP